MTGGGAQQLRPAFSAVCGQHHMSSGVQAVAQDQVTAPGHRATHVLRALRRRIKASCQAHQLPDVDALRQGLVQVCANCGGVGRRVRYRGCRDAHAWHAGAWRPLRGAANALPLALWPLKTLGLSSKPPVPYSHRKREACAGARGQRRRRWCPEHRTSPSPRIRSAWKAGWTVHSAATLSRAHGMASCGVRAALACCPGFQARSSTLMSLISPLRTVLCCRTSRRRLLHSAAVSPAVPPTAPLERGLRGKRWIDYARKYSK
jgi:hypothetical protein